MKRVLSGIQPTGDVHLGNYIGAFKRWVDLQHERDAFHMIADLHAMTVPHDPAELRAKTVETAMMLLAAGLDPDVVTLFAHSQVHEHAELAWILMCVATMGEAHRMVQFKEKAGAGRDSVSVGLFTYPVLQAADILIYQADEVPVGEDQRQHVEFTRDVAQRFNHRFGEVFRIPAATTPTVGARVMDLQFVDKKMSKSLDSPRGTINVLDPPDVIVKKVKAAVTDSGSEVKAGSDKPGVTNLLDLFAAVTGDDVATIEDRFAGEGYGVFKATLADAVVEFLRPLQSRHAELSGDLGHVRDVLDQGADKAQTVAADTLGRAKDAVGLLPRQARSVT